MQSIQLRWFVEEQLVAVVSSWNSTRVPEYSKTKSTPVLQQSLDGGISWQNIPVVISQVVDLRNKD